MILKEYMIFENLHKNLLIAKMLIRFNFDSQEDSKI
jgi:hypothetical protein